MSSRVTKYSTQVGKT